MDNENQSYESVVSESVSCLIDEMRDEYESGSTGEALRECLQERVWEHCDGHMWVIHTHRAKRIVCESSNSGAYSENCGDEGMTENGEIAWSKLAYFALEADIYEQMDRQDFNSNDPAKFFESEAEEKKERA